ncbi:MAG: hypothetical protein IH851_03085 [Armatimonadetes bacterium]|nr:hypothetical protein [Armatimonadota bacterium]
MAYDGQDIPRVDPYPHVSDRVRPAEQNPNRKQRQQRDDERKAPDDVLDLHDEEARDDDPRSQGGQAPADEGVPAKERPDSEDEDSGDSLDISA